jgi:hypothetical protein
MMKQEQVQLAVHNNALWCDIVCRAHGRPGAFLETLWLHRHEPLPYYPNAVTLAAGGTSAQLGCIRDLITMGLPGAWGVKDSFCTLDLEPLGFHPLFEAQWLWRATSKPEHDLPGVHWLQIQEAAEMAAWERAWRGESTDEVSSGQARIFLPSLLADENIAFIAAYQDQQLIAGAIANRTGGVVGLSNVFLPTQDEGSFRAGCIATVMDIFPTLPLVGYEAGHDLTGFQSLGFEPVGPLRVWLRPAVS